VADRYDRPFGTVAVSASFLAIGLASIYWMARWGLENPVRPVVEVAALSLFMIDAPYVAQLITRRASPAATWRTSWSAYSLLSVLMVVLAGRFIGHSALPVFAIGGAVAFMVTLVDWIRSGSLWRSAVIVLGSLAFSTFAGGVVWGRIYKSPLFMEMLSATGIVHHDSIALAGYANMLLTYGVATPGLDGIPQMLYHWGTPWMFGQMSDLLGRSPLDFYNFGYVITILPFFFGGILAFATEMRSVLARSTSIDLRDNLGVVLVFLIAVVGVFPITGMDAMGVWTSNIMISESYAAALPVALLLLSMTVIWWRGERRDWIYPALILVPGILLLGYLKISMMILGFVAAIYAGLRKKLYRRPGFIVIGIALTILVAITWSNVSLPEHREGLVPLDFLKGFVPPAWWPFFFLVHLFWSWFYVALRLRNQGITTLADLRAALRENRILDVEIVALIALAGVGPGLIIHIDGGSAFYFSDIQRWVSVGMIIAGAGTLLHLPRVFQRGEEGFALTRVRVRTLLLALVALPMLVSMAMNFVHWTRRMLAMNAATMQAVHDAGGVERTKNYFVLSELQDIGRMPRSEKERTALFIPQAETEYWDLLERPGACSFSGHIAPAITGVAAVDGMPPHGCELSRYYGLGLFEKRTRPQMPQDTLPEVLCQRAARAGLVRVLTVHFDSTGRAAKRVDECRIAG
jgi:hypothetical protein